MTAVRKGERVVDGRPKRRGEVGTVHADSDPITKLARVDWDRGGSSLVFVGVLQLAGDGGRVGL